MMDTSYTSSTANFCQNISAPSAGSGAAANSSSADQGHGQQQQQLGGGNANSSHLSVIQSFLQQRQQQQEQQEQPAPKPAAPGAAALDGDDQQQQTWRSCRFCHQKFCATPDLMLQHEMSCPMHLQIQQFMRLQQQQRQMQQQPLQGEVQHLQQGEVQTQLSLQQSQQGMDSQYGLSNMFNGSFLPHANSNGLHAQAPSQNQGLSSLIQQQRQFIDAQQPFSQAQVGTSRSGRPNSGTPLSQQEDHFESAIDSLPAFTEKPPTPLKPSSPSPTTGARYFPLCLPEDEEWLTPLHCFVRQHCVEVFVATPEDVAAPCMGKRNPVSVGQVGIRCPYCSPDRLKDSKGNKDATRARENGVVYPSLITRIYNSSINLLQRHLRSCSFVPPGVLSRYEELKVSKARSGASKKYWADSAARVGLIDTPDGIRLDVKTYEAHRNAGAKKKASGQEKSEAPPLVLPSDKRNTTAFTFHLMSQMQPCVFTEADRLGRRRTLEVGFAGFACRHCFGRYGSGRFFPSSVKTMADASKTLDVIYRHITKCKDCPSNIRGGLRNLRDFHDSERSKMPFGNQRAFFVKIWGRLHGAAGEASTLAVAEGTSPFTTTAESSPSMVPALPAPNMSATAGTLSPMIPLNTPPVLNGPGKFGVSAPLGCDSIQSLYAMVRRESSEENQNHKKLTNEAA